MIGEDFWRKWCPTSVIEASLSHIANVDGFDWNKPLSQWSRDEMVRFMREVLYIIQNEMMKREKISPFDDEIPFAVASAFLVPFALMVVSHIV